MLKSIYFLPHGMQMIDGLEQPYNENFRSLHEMMQQISNEIESDGSDMVLLVTPHGYNLSNKYLIYQHDEFQGYLYSVSDDDVVKGNLVSKHSWIGDSARSIELLNILEENNIPVESLVQGFSSYPLVLAWGEVVPLYYALAKQDAKVVILCVPRSRLEIILDMQTHLKKIGELLQHFCNLVDEKVSIIISGDLSHVHKEDGPYGFDESAKIFDAKFCDWVNQPQPDSYLEILDLQPKALACGMAGIGILQGLFDRIKGNGSSIKNDINYYDVPTYFGMGIAKWIIID
ncbi:MAG: hypothetical protein OEZ01_10075 [Candidatus Heimdallarchaeota archaeon]|nr:hypothetical protein [Candidatus Heimdallarchaeota archaeon]MDH5646345.1 hypothetical protein [Candidatus Heimdallarchaeota archaeon]